MGSRNAGSPPARSRRRRGAARATTAPSGRPSGFGEQCVQVERDRHHRHASVRVARPFLPRAVTVELDAVSVRVVEVDGLADAVIGSTGERHTRIDEPAERIRELRAIGIADRGVEEPGVARRRRRAALALPGVQSDVMVITARRDERGLVAQPLLQLEARARRRRTRASVRCPPPSDGHGRCRHVDRSCSSSDDTRVRDRYALERTAGWRRARIAVATCRRTRPSVPPAGAAPTCPPEEPLEEPVEIRSTRDPRYFGLASPVFVFGVLLALLVAGIVLIALGALVVGVIAIVLAVCLHPTFLAGARRWPETRLARAGVSTADRVRDEADVAVESISTWSKASREVVRLRKEQFQLRRERDARIRELGASVYADDGRAGELKASARARRPPSRNERELQRTIAGARRRTRKRRAAVAATQIIEPERESAEES